MRGEILGLAAAGELVQTLAGLARYLHFKHREPACRCDILADLSLRHALAFDFAVALFEPSVHRGDIRLGVISSL
jgi:hypothetical protein